MRSTLETLTDSDIDLAIGALLVADAMSVLELPVATEAMVELQRRSKEYGVPLQAVIVKLLGVKGRLGAAEEN